MDTDLQTILKTHNPVRVDFRTRHGQAIRKPFMGLDNKPVWYLQNGRACVFGPKDSRGIRPVLFIEKRKSPYVE